MAELDHMILRVCNPANLDPNLTLAELAAVADFSDSPFNELSRYAAGMPAHRFVLARRVEAPSSCSQAN